MWFNGLVAMLVPTVDYWQTQLPFLRDILPIPLYMWAFTAVVVGNMVLRFFVTKQALENK
jgi:hypothetical protein